MTDLRDIILTVPVFLFSISFHEYAHALTAVMLGDPTPRLQGRLTLNFLAHFSWLGALMLLVAGIGWAKPVQVSAHNFRNPNLGMLWVSLAGPVANLLLAIGFAVALRLVAPITGFQSVAAQAIGSLLMVGVQLNLLLAFFNLVPVPPLDGSKVLVPFLPRIWAYRLMQLEPWGFLIIWVLLQYTSLWRFLQALTGVLLRGLIGF